MMDLVLLLMAVVGLSLTISQVIESYKELGYNSICWPLAFVMNSLIGIPLLIVGFYKSYKELSEGSDGN